ncbi:MAG: hypothetical protein U5N26_10510 [Candidatus Marinimicrobia bacterium]|nr:hypothetical protein [Candidatus Neomarinimicrobiota bacterium]
MIMPNFTPEKYKKHYEIYPDKAGASDPAERTMETLLDQIREAGRHVEKGYGHSIKNAWNTRDVALLRCRVVEVSRCRVVEVSRCRGVEVSRCRDVGRRDNMYIVMLNEVQHPHCLTTEYCLAFSV